MRLPLVAAFSCQPGSEISMPDTPGTEPDASHPEAGTAGEAVQVERRTAAEHEQQETSNEEDGQ